MADDHLTSEQPSNNKRIFKSSSIIELNALDTTVFETEFLRCGKPAILRGFANSWPAIKWTLAELRRKAGENIVNVRRNTDSDEYKIGQKYNIEKMKFSEYIGNLMKGNKKSQGSYLAVQNIKQAFSQLESEILIPEFVGKIHAGPFLWIANKGHYEFCHFDPDDNCLVVLNGCKKVKLYGCELKPLYPNQLGSKGRTIQSQVFCDEPDLKQFPEFAHATCYECTLRSGDLLYFPAFWWHQVTSTQTTISINLFFGENGENNFLTKVMNSNQWDAFRYWLLNIIEQNRVTEQFQRVLHHLPQSVAAFLLKQWHETPSQEQLDKLVSVIMKYLNIDELPRQQITVKNPPPLKIRGLLWRS